MRYAWPGNVRELRNVIERIVIMNPTTSRFERKHLPPLVHRDGNRRVAGSEGSTLHQARAAYERDYILKSWMKIMATSAAPRSAGSGAQPFVSQDEESGDCGERVEQLPVLRKCKTSWRRNPIP